ncbi:hypothetical protein MKX07_005541 [Trichoderma sp. CBMAI-0711]|uniref:DUF1770-domain-containing protein n=1 Tax=Trichoderma parareesei TaxID=858221 RepID=A0A2H2ZFC9_TRIPA|nr:hypothetical protein MKX07_005541 [Trichoderma sp. CBMAI-0711]OTA02050.1 hypothetical protein A9Z42_0023790 [Trichoderma parareesei]
MASSLPTELGSTIQAGHIRRHPDPRQDVAPSTAADRRHLVDLHSARRSDIDVSEDEDDIPYSVLRPPKKHYHLPPLPDLRFEQSYLHSIASADTWWKVLLITVRDQVLMPLAQGVLLNLALVGWHHWNKNARLHGDSVGVRLRRWWYGVNNWKLPNNPNVKRRM